jgi:cadmium resistance protein CadD (predicted permease)
MYSSADPTFATTGLDNITLFIPPLTILTKRTMLCGVLIVFKCCTKLTAPLCRVNHDIDFL